MNKHLPIVALVGLPNAGKSTLLNKISGRQLAVTSDLPGTTRDRQYANTAWNGSAFTLADTAGMSTNTLNDLEQNVNKQIEIALKEADVIVWVVDGKEPVGKVPQVLKQRFRKIQKPVVLAVNKLDGSKFWNEKTAEFKALGIKNIFPVSALNGRGLGDFLDKVVESLPTKDEADEYLQTPADSIAVSIVGKPNVGKSSIFNKILDEERVVVSPVAGTTRTAIDSDIRIDGQNYTFIDTAGLKKKEHRQEQPDVFSGFQTFKSIRRSDICFFVIDATQEITKQDQRVAQEIFALDRGCIILANKCDLLPAVGNGLDRSLQRKNVKSIEKNRDDKYQTTRDYISHHFPFLWMCPLFFISGLTGEGLKEAVDSIKPIFERRHKTIPSEVLTVFLKKAMAINSPKLLRDQKKPKVFSLRQADANPPIFELLVNHPATISQQFRKFLENSIMRELDFYGTPIVLRLRGKDKT
ncbi:MAG: ribosome biogenesis GTPase Der [Candidatus Doudnabacteria bacterium]|nr:ribosome biogenesis GTPase Der [Candidatus Doudnabacteria bacterium]